METNLAQRVAVLVEDDVRELTFPLLCSEGQAMFSRLSDGKVVVSRHRAAEPDLFTFVLNLTRANSCGILVRSAYGESTFLSISVSTLR